MNNLKIWKRSLLALVLLGSTSLAVAQSSYKETFKVNKEALVTVNTSHTNVVFETWNKDYVEVEAYVSGEDLSAKEKQEIFDDWSFDVLGNSKKVVITSNEGSLWGGFESLKSLEGLSELESLNNAEALKALESLKDMPVMDFAYDFKVPDVPDYKDFPQWPFGDQSPSFISKDGTTVIRDHNNDYEFDTEEYEKNKQAYVNKLNKKYKSNATVRQVDRWLEDVDQWATEFEAVMEDWGENFAEEFELKLGPEFEMKMEKWGEEFAESWEQWGEEFGEEFGEKMEAWGEEFGKDMEKWAEQFEKDAEKWAEKYGEDEDGNIFIKSGKGNLFEEVKAQKTIIIRMPKGTKTDINVRHGEVKMADAVNVKATLNYSALSANSIDGGNTLINASYAPVYVNNWQDGTLMVNYVDDCRLNNVKVIHLEANSSDVNINSLLEKGLLTGSFGNLFINNISNNFDSVDIMLENTDATLDLPDTAFKFYFSGKKSTLKRPNSLQVTESGSSARKLVKGYNKSNSTSKSLSITASYSNVSMQ